MSFGQFVARNIARIKVEDHWIFNAMRSLRIETNQLIYAVPFLTRFYLKLLFIVNQIHLKMFLTIELLLTLGIIVTPMYI